MADHNKSYQAGLHGQSDIGMNRDAWVGGMLARQAEEKRRAGEARSSGSLYGGGGLPGVAAIGGGAGSLGTFAAFILIGSFLYSYYAVLVAGVAIATSILVTVVVGSLVLALLGLPGLKLTELLVKSSGRPSGLFRGYWTLLRSFLAFGAAAALAYGLLYGLYYLTGGVLHTPIPGFRPIALVLQASSYAFNNGEVPAGLVALLDPAYIALTIAFVVVIAFLAAIWTLRLCDRPRFAGVAGFGRGLLVIAVPVLVALVALAALAVYFAETGW